MHRTRVKICGIRTVEDALAAARAGADAIGMIFHPPSGRNINLSTALEIVSALPPFVTPVGLFVDSDVARIREIARPLGLRTIQLHGRESGKVVADLREFVVLKAVRVDPDTFGAELDSWRKTIAELNLTNLRGLVLETAGSVGGSGKSNDWETVRRHLERGDFAGLPPLIAAGGLTPLSVGAVVSKIHPWAVDVSSGVESSPGRKSPELMESFIRAVRLGEQDDTSSHPPPSI